ncbi:hypothetical protein JCM1840_001079 [Sporobolomyces johnsonii]
MDTLGGFLLRTRVVGRLLKPREIQAVLAYLVISSLASVAGSVVGSFSEYRLPYPLLTTELHLLLALAALTAVQSVARTLQGRPITRRLLTTVSSKSSTDAPASTAPPSDDTSSASFLSSQLRPLAALADTLSPFTLFAALASTLSSLFEIHARRIADPSFWAFARLLPLFLLAVLPAILPVDVAPPFLAQSQNKAAGLVCWVVLAGGRGIAAVANGEGWFCGVGWAAGVLAWVGAVQTGFIDASSGSKAGVKEGSDASAPSSPPSIFAHLLLSSLLLLPPLLLSGELVAAAKYRHFGFFTEPGFWLQEIVMAGCGLVGLAVFWELIKHLDPLSVFLVIALKDFITPHLYALMLGNPLDSPSPGQATFSTRQQLVALTVVGVVCAVTRRSGSGPRVQEKER